MIRKDKLCSEIKGTIRINKVRQYTEYVWKPTHTCASKAPIDNGIGSCHITDDGKHIMTLSSPGTSLALSDTWYIQRKNPSYTYNMSHKDRLAVPGVHICLVSSCGGLIVTISQSEFSIWTRLSTFTKVWSGRIGVHGGAYTCGSLSHCGSMLAMGTDTGSFFVYDIRRGNPKRVLELTGKQSPHTKPIDHCVICRIPNRSNKTSSRVQIFRYRFATVCASTKTCIVRDFEIQGTVHNPLFSIELTNIFHESTDSVGPHVTSLAACRNGRLVVMGRSTGTCSILTWKSQKSEPVESIVKSARQKDRIVACSISACGYSFITTTHTAKVTVWRKSFATKWTRSLVLDYSKYALRAFDCCAAAEGTRFVIGFQQGLCVLLDIKSLKCRFRGQPNYSVNLVTQMAEHKNRTAVVADEEPGFWIHSICPVAIYVGIRDAFRKIAQDETHHFDKQNLNPHKTSQSICDLLVRGLYSPGQKWTYDSNLCQSVLTRSVCTFSSRGFHFMNECIPVVKHRYPMYLQRIHPTGEGKLVYANRGKTGVYYAQDGWIAVTVPVLNDDKVVQVFVQHPDSKCNRNSITRVVRGLRSLVECAAPKKYATCALVSPTEKFKKIKCIDLKQNKCVQNDSVVAAKQLLCIDVGHLGVNVTSASDEFNPVYVHTLNEYPGTHIELVGSIAWLYCTAKLNEFIVGAHITA